MNTFLPYKDFTKSAQCLDYRRLGKQRVEAWQIYLALTKPDYGWKHHPIVKMWKGYENALLEYGIAICKEWKNRGFKDTMFERFYTAYPWHQPAPKPYWFGNRKFHSAMRSNLLKKDKQYYSKFGWKESDNLPYVWIITERRNK